MDYALGLVIFVLLLALLYKMLKFSSADRYAKMTGKQFEDDAKRASPVGGVMLAVQKLVDPSHRMEYVEQAEAQQEDGMKSGDTPAR